MKIILPRIFLKYMMFFIISKCVISVQFFRVDPWKLNVHLHRFVSNDVKACATSS